VCVRERASIPEVSAELSPEARKEERDGDGWREAERERREREREERGEKDRREDKKVRVRE